MKKILMIGLVSLAGAGAYAQGTLIFYNSFADDVFQVYAPDPANPLVSDEGFTSAQATTINNGGAFTASPVVTFGGQVIGGSASSGSVPATIGVSSPYYSDGNLFTAQIYALSAGNGSGSVPAFSSLLPVTQYIENFSTAGGSGNAFLNTTTLSSDPGIPGTGYSGSGIHASSIFNNAFVGMAAWYNAGGLYTTLAQAQAAGAPWGESGVVLLGGLGEPASVNTAAHVNNNQPSTPTEPYGLNSFSLVTSTPEPSTIALGVMGVGAFLARRRKK